MKTTYVLDVMTSTKLFAHRRTYFRSADTIQCGQAVLEAGIRELQREDDAAASEVRQRKEMRRLGDQAAARNALSLPQAALTAALAALERERSELLSQGNGSRAPRINRAEELRARMAAIMAAYEGLIESGLKALTGEGRFVDIGQ